MAIFPVRFRLSYCVPRLYLAESQASYSYIYLFRIRYHNERLERIAGDVEV